MHSYFLFAAVCALITGSVNAAAITSSATCNADNCLRAVVASSHTPGPSSASKDCASFFMKTVTPATVTSTATVYTTTTASTATVTDVNTIEATTLLTTVPIITVPTTQLETSVVTTVPVITLLTTVVDTIIDDVTTTVIEAKKRQVSAYKMRHALDFQGTVLDRRQMTVAPSSVPAYASACSGTVRYSSACSCIGVTQTTTTVAAPTTTKTVTITITATATSTVQASTTIVNTLVTTILSTTIIDTTIIDTIVTTIPSTTVIPDTVTDTVTVVASTVVACPASPTFLLQAIGGGVNGQYAFVTGSDNGYSDQVISFVSTPGAASPFTVDSAGHLVTGGSLANIDDVPAETIFFDTPAQLSAGNESDLECIPPVPYGQLSCTAGSDGDSLFQVCPAGSVDADGSPLSGVAIGVGLRPGCQALGFTLIPTC